MPNPDDLDDHFDYDPVTYFLVSLVGLALGSVGGS